MRRWSNVRREVTPDRRERIDAIKAQMALREAAQRVIDVVDEPSPVDDGTPEVEARWYYEWEVRHRTAIEALRAALATPRTEASDTP